MAEETPVVALTLRLPAVLRARLYAARGENSLNAEIVNRLAASFVVKDGALAEPSGSMDAERAYPASASHTPGSASALGKAAVRVDPPAAAAPSASELAAKIAGVSLAKDATPFPKGKQAGRAKS